MRKLLVIVDFREVIDQIASKRGLYYFLSKFTLHDFIETLLSICPYIDYSLHVYDAFEMRFDPDDETIDREYFELLCQTLVAELDGKIAESFKGIDVDIEIYKKYRIDINKASYTFVKWIDNTSALIKFED